MTEPKPLSDSEMLDLRDRCKCSNSLTSESY